MARRSRQINLADASRQGKKAIQKPLLPSKTEKRFSWPLLAFSPLPLPAPPFFRPLHHSAKHGDIQLKDARVTLFIHSQNPSDTFSFSPHTSTASKRDACPPTAFPVGSSLSQRSFPPSNARGKIDDPKNACARHPSQALRRHDAP